jgi:hypothetical protein
MGIGARHHGPRAVVVLGKAVLGVAVCGAAALACDARPAPANESASSNRAYREVRVVVNPDVTLGGEAAVQAYNAGLALYAKRTLEALWQVPEMVPESMIAGAMAIVKIPTQNSTVCGIVGSTLRYVYNMSTSGWAPVGDFICYFRISAQVYLERSDIDLLGSAVLSIIENLGDTSFVRRARDK